MNIIDESVKKVDEMSALAKHRTLAAAKVEFERGAVRRAIMDEYKAFADKGYGEFYFIDKHVIFEALRENETLYGIYDVEKKRTHHEYYRMLPHALLALSAIIGGGEVSGVTYASRVLDLKSPE